MITVTDITLHSHLLERIHYSTITRTPFWHCFIENIFPEEFYCNLLAWKQRIRKDGLYTPRQQDSPHFVNRRFRLFGLEEPMVQSLHRLFSDREMQLALFQLFYYNPSKGLLENATIHREFEFVFCHPGLFQQIHVDIPPKLLSFVFYLPDEKVSPDQERANATILYNRDLRPTGSAEYRPNSGCIFAPHFSSYHGFSTTIERDVLVMFYVHRGELLKWNLAQLASRFKNLERPPYAFLKDRIEKKLSRFPLLEYGHRSTSLAQERAACRVNAPFGRVFSDKN